MRGQRLGLGLGARKRGSAYSPLSEGSLGFWVDFSKTASLTVGGGNAVSQARDMGGYALHLVQATAGKQGTLTSGLIGERSALALNGSQAMAAVAAAPLDSAQVTIFAVVLWNGDTSPTSQVALGKRDAGATTGWNAGATASDNSAWGGWATAAAASSGRAMTAGIPALLTLRYDGTTVASWLDGVAAGTAAASGATGASGQTLVLGAADNAASPANGLIGAIGEVLAFATALPTAARQRVEQYLTAKWLLGNLVLTRAGASEPITTRAGDYLHWR